MKTQRFMKMILLLTVSLSVGALARPYGDDWMLPEAQMDEIVLARLAGSESAASFAAEASVPQLVVSQTLVKTYIPVTFDAAGFEVQSPSTAIYAWDLTGDGETDASSGASSLRYTYRTSGTYPVRVHITDAAGTDLLSAPVDVTATNRTPVAKFSTLSGFATDLVPAEFEDASSDLDGSIVAWSWDFGDGASSGERSPLHAYARAGDYTVTLVVADNEGSLSEAFSQRITILNAPPIASFDAPASARVGETVVFQDRSIDPSETGRIVYIAWDFGDGAYQTGTPTGSSTYRHSYVAAGEYAVTLFVIDDAGDLSTARRAIRVTE